VAYTCSGEWPLFFAACTNQATMVDVLVAAGADLDAHDCNGNTILHLLVYHELPEMYDHVVDLWKHQRGIRGAEEERDNPCVAPLSSTGTGTRTRTDCHLVSPAFIVLSCAVMCCHVLSRVLTLHGRGLDTRTHTAAVSKPAPTQHHHHHHHHVMRQLCSPQFVTALVCLCVCRRVLQPHLLLPSLPPLQGPAPVFECAEQ
jgi:hypothetical protein